MSTRNGVQKFDGDPDADKKPAIDVNRFGKQRNRSKSSYLTCAAAFLEGGKPVQDFDPVAEGGVPVDTEQQSALPASSTVPTLPTPPAGPSLWEKANTGIVSPDTIKRAAFGMNGEELRQAGDELYGGVNEPIPLNRSSSCFESASGA